MEILEGKSMMEIREKKSMMEILRSHHTATVKYL